jgi:DNA modification methylase
MDYKKDLAEKLPQLKEIDGFPKGSDEDIIALSQPPYFTACPNPYIKDFIKEHGKGYDENNDNYKVEPYIADIDEGKNSKLYKAHSYHTKVPYEAIKTYIEHYTSEGDIVIDGFMGSGMVGIAAQLSNRHAIISDLSPFAGFLANNYNKFDINFKKETAEFIDIVNKISKELDWLYTTEINGKRALVNYSILSRIFLCPICKTEYEFWDYAVDKKTEKVNDSYNCKACSADINKKDSISKFVVINDKALNENINQVEYVVSVNDVNQNGKRFKLAASDYDKLVQEKINNYLIPNWYPTDRMPPGDESRRNDKFGFTHIHHFYTKRTLIALSAIYEELKTEYQKYIFTSIISMRCTMRMPYRPGGKSAGTVNNLNIPSIIQEYNVFDTVIRKARKIYSAFNEVQGKLTTKGKGKVIVSVNSITSLSSLIPVNSVDYIFTDPPFGSNIMYSELSFFWESWLKITTNNLKEAIISNTQSKKESEYYTLMLASFNEYYKILKPKRWITVEFHNSKSSIWNLIQESISKAGFIISSVAILNKKQGSFTQVTSAGSVEKDLVISAYKPSSNFERRFISQAGQDLEIEFINQHLSMLPTQSTVERSEKMLYSKMLAYYIQRGYEIRYDAKSFYSLLNQNFAQEDGFWFTANQINSYLEYKKRMKLDGIDEVKAGGMFLFVTDEKSAIVWLFNFLSEPKSFSDVSVAFNQLANIQGDAVPELREMLEQNFVFEDGKYRRPKSEPEHNQIAEKREKALMREFESLLIQAKTDKKKIKEVRKEALVYGFEVCYKDKRFIDIMAIAQKLDKSILENSGELSDFVEAAEIQLEGIS